MTPSTDLAWAASVWKVTAAARAGAASFCAWVEMTLGSWKAVGGRTRSRERCKESHLYKMCRG